MMIDSKRDVENLNYIFDNAKIGIAVCSTTENIIEVMNPAFASIYGYEMDELIGRSMCRVFTSDCKECDLRGKPLAYCTTNDSSFETTHTKKDGSTVDVCVYITVIKDKNDEVQQRIVNITDITKRKSYEKTLQETNSKLEAVISTIPDMIWIKDKKGDYLTCNKSFADFFTTTPDEVVGKNDYDFFTKEAAEVCRATDLEALQSDTVTFSEEIIIYPKSNNKGILEVRKIPVMQATGDVLGILGIGRDITEQRKIEENLAIKEREFRSLAENSPDIIVRYDCNFKRVYVNPAYEQINNTTKEEALGKSPTEKSWAISNMLPTYEQFLKTIIQTKKSATQDFSFIDKDEKTIYISQIGVPEFSSDGTLSGILTVGRNVTDSKQAEYALKEKNSQYNQILDNSTDVIYLIEVTKDGRFIHKDINRAYVEVVGMPKKAVVGRYVDEIENEESREILIDKYSSCVKAREKTDYINDYNLPAGRRTFHSTLSPIFDENGDIYQIVGVARDITERIRQEKLLYKKEKEFRSLAENLPDNIVRFDKDGNYLYLNPTHEQILGCKATEVLGKSIKHLFPHHTEVICAIEKIQKLESDSIIVRQSVPGLNGTTKIHEVKLVGEKNEQGELTSILGIGRDITEIVSMHEQLTQAVEVRRGIINSIPDLLFEVNKEGDYLNFWFHDNEMMHEYRKNLLGKNIRDILPYQAANIAFEALEEADKNGISLEKRYSLREDDTLMKWYELSVSKKSDGNFLALVHEITSQVRMQEDIKKQKDFQETLLRGIAKAGMSVNVIEDGRYIYTNNVSLAKEYGYDETLSEKKPSILETIHPEHKEKVAQIHQKRLAGEEVTNTYSIVQVKPNGEEREHEISAVLIPNSNPIQTLVVSRDVTEQKNIERRIEFMAHHDILTGLVNKAFAQKKTTKILEDAKINQEQVAFLFLDLDGFKVINDTLGHSVGDSMLKSIALHLKQCVRESDVVSRQGGDEFLIILQHITDKNDIFKVVEKIFKQLEEPFHVATHMLSISASLGISLYPTHGKTFETLFKNADAAMYQAKEYGKNGYRMYKSHMNHNMIGRFKLHSDLKNALQRNEFMLHYQPQIDVVENKITGVEALIRWNHPQMGLVPPMNFIPIAESSGLIVQIGQWVIEEACRQMILWHQQGCKISIAVNISAIQFKRGDIENVIIQALQRTGLDPRYLELELTETIMMHDVESTLQTVQNLKLLGVQLSIDDFGTGYSSLSYLKRFAVDKLKIDQSFVRGILNNKEDAVIVNTIIQMAKNLNLKTIAEGVEDAEVLSLIEQLGCDEVQGYHFAKPMNALDFDSYFQSFS